VNCSELCLLTLCQFVTGACGLRLGHRILSCIAMLSNKYEVEANRLDAFGCGIYSRVASNEAEIGRTKNRRVELLQW
jgi:hypothetical protein